MSISKFGKFFVLVVTAFAAIACDQPDQLNGEEAGFRAANNSSCKAYETMTICDLTNGCYDAMSANWSAFVCVDDLIVCVDGSTSCTTADKEPKECYMAGYDIVDCIGALVAQALCKTNPADCSPDEEEDQ